MLPSRIETEWLANWHRRVRFEFDATQRCEVPPDGLSQVHFAHTIAVDGRNDDRREISLHGTTIEGGTHTQPLFHPGVNIADG